MIKLFLLLIINVVNLPLIEEIQVSSQVKLLLELKDDEQLRFAKCIEEALAPARTENQNEISNKNSKLRFQSFYLLIVICFH